MNTQNAKKVILVSPLKDVNDNEKIVGEQNRANQKRALQVNHMPIQLDSIGTKKTIFAKLKIYT